MAPDTGESCGLEIRRGVCQFHPSLPESRDAALTFPRAFLSNWAGGGISFDKGIESGDVNLEGDRNAVTTFFEKFEPAEGTGPFGMSVR